MEIPNYYENLPEPSNLHRNYCKDMPQHPFRLSIVGPSNSGKTNILIHIIKKCRNFDKIYLYAKKLDEPLYEHLIDHWTRVGDMHRLNLIEYSNDISETVEVDDINENIQNLIIFDDMVCEASKSLKDVEEFFIRGRKQNASIIFISQSYFSIPKNIRLNCDYFVITKIGNKKELTEITKDHTTENNNFNEIFKEATRDPYSILLIDLKTQDPELKYRKNFKIALH